MILFTYRSEWKTSFDFAKHVVREHEMDGSTKIKMVLQSMFNCNMKYQGKTSNLPILKGFSHIPRFSTTTFFRHRLRKRNFGYTSINIKLI